MGSKTLIAVAINHFIGDFPLTDAKRRKLSRYMQRNLDHFHCCVLWERDKTLCNLMEKLGVPPEVYNTHEVIITGSTVQFTSEYKKYPPRLVYKEEIRLGVLVYENYHG